MVCFFFAGDKVLLTNDIILLHVITFLHVIATDNIRRHLSFSESVKSMPFTCRT